MELPILLSWRCTDDDMIQFIVMDRHDAPTYILTVPLSLVHGMQQDEGLRVALEYHGKLKRKRYLWVEFRV